MLVLESDGFLDDLELGHNPGIALVAMGVQFGERLETFSWFSMINEPLPARVSFPAEHQITFRPILTLGLSGNSIMRSARRPAGIS